MAKGTKKIKGVFDSEHPVRTPKGFVEAGLLKVDDEIICTDGRLAKITKSIPSIKPNRVSIIAELIKIND